MYLCNIYTISIQFSKLNKTLETWRKNVVHMRKIWSCVTDKYIKFCTYWYTRSDKKTGLSMSKYIHKYVQHIGRINRIIIEKGQKLSKRTEAKVVISSVDLTMNKKLQNLSITWSAFHFKKILRLHSVSMSSSLFINECSRNNLA